MPDSLFIKLISYYLILCILSDIEARPQKNFKENRKCGYNSCPISKPGMLNVHLVAHTHDDVGWLKTVDQYYYGSKTLIQKAGVQYILDSVIQELLKDQKKKFIYVESAFFFKWWREQTPAMQDQVKMLVNEGRLEFIGGAWSMNDEATTHYQSIIDQFSWGLRRLNETFGECGRPRVGWQIDPFGHSREMASIFARMGYDGLFFGRLDYQDKRERLINHKAEMIWKASSNLGEKSHLFTGALFNQYQPPPGFCFDILCADEPIIDGKHSPDNNVDEKISKFFEFVNEQRNYYQSKNIIITMGGDFTYMDANSYYKNLDKLIRYGNEKQQNGSDINLFYSTPSCYLKSLHDSNLTWPTKNDDFFPYASDPHAFWTGYFTSRPTLKRYERVGNHFHQICKQLTAISKKREPEFIPHLSFMRETMGVMQHHDAITGTEKQKVAFDYAKRLSVGIRACGTVTKAVLNHITTGEDALPKPDNPKRKDYKFEFKSCHFLNISSCNISESSKRFIVTLYNPLAHSTFEYVRVPVTGTNYEVFDYREVSIDSEIVPVPEAVRSLDFRKSAAKYDLVFLASELPPLGYKSYYIVKTNDYRLGPIVESLPKERSSLTTIGNENLVLTFDTNGYLTTVTSDNITRQIYQEFFYYEASAGNNREFINRSSGAYIFRPKHNRERHIAVDKISVFRGNLVQEVHQTFNDWTSQVVRVYRKEKFAEFEWLVGPIPVEDGIGKEVVSFFKSDIESDGIFYTDSNGREMIKRMRNHRDTWDVKLEEYEAGNYYPITTKIALEDENARMAILVDRAQGGSSLQDGSLEIMVHRRLLHDDAFGVDEALNETAYGNGLIARGIHYLVIGPSQLIHSPTTQAAERFLQTQKLLPSWRFFNDAENYPYDEWRMNYTNIFSAITLSLPQNIHLMTFEPWRENEILIRFEHILEKDEDPEYSKPVKFFLTDVLRGFPIEMIRETTLDGNQWLEDLDRMKFNSDSNWDVYETIPRSTSTRNFVSVLSARKPLVETKYENEQTNVIDHRLTRKSFKNELNCLRSEKLANLNLELNIEDEPNVSNEDDDKYVIIMEPMQIRTYVLSLEKSFKSI